MQAPSFSSSEVASYPGAEAPARQYFVPADGVRIAVHEWGAAAAPPLVLAHGGADFARTFDRFAPLLAAAGYRAVSWDHRGHGDSDRAALYSWDADLRDALAVLATLGSAPLPVVGHSKGGGLLSHLCAAFPERFSHFVNIDGLPSPTPRRDRRLDRVAHLRGYLDLRRAAHTAGRRPGTLEELAQRRARMNPRLPIAWLRYLVTVGATRAADGWRFKLDPMMSWGPTGPWQPSWGLRGLRALRVPMLALLGAIAEPMGWGTDPEAVRPYLPEGALLEVVPDTGHFVHIEQPDRTARRVLEFLR